ncbi:octicosapeptide/Phox/Bem1p family protein isoform X2 [Tasmannia lanceolata]
MTSNHPSEPADSVTSTPKSESRPQKCHNDIEPHVRFMCSFGGRILPRPHDNQLRYVGGETRIVSVHRATTFSHLLPKLSKLSNTNDITVKYQLPNEDLDALISVTTDEDVENMMEEYDRLFSHDAVNSKTARLRLFLFPLGGGSRAGSCISSLLDGSAKREHWFLDALNGGSASLESGRSEVSSVVSEMPDYLFGLEHSDDPKPKSRLAENVSVASDPGSPVPPSMPSPYCSTSSTTGGAPIPDLPPVNSKPEIKENQIQVESPAVVQQIGYAGNPIWHYMPESQLHGPSVQPVPVYYVQVGNVPIGQVPAAPMPYLQQVPMAPATAQIFHHQIPSVQNNTVGVSHMYAQAVRPGEMKPGPAGKAYDYPAGVISDGMTQQVYYGAV